MQKLENYMSVELIPSECEVHHVVANISDDDDWRKPFLDYFNHGILPNDVVEWRRLQRRLPSYVVKARTLYWRSFGHEMLLRCVSINEADQIKKEVHHGVCGGHQCGPKMYHSIKLWGYYWPGIMKDCLKIARSCHSCQVHGVIKHQPLVPLDPTVPA